MPDTVVLVHGLWMTPRSWEGWVAHYEAKGLTVLTPGYPGFEIEVEALRENPDIIANLTVPETVDHLAAAVESAATPPIIMGHSFGGTLTQLLLARGLGSAGVVVDSAPTEGVRVNPLSQARSLFPALKNPANRHRAVGFTPEEFHYAFTNTLTEEESREVWERYAIAAPGQLGVGVRPLRQLQARPPGHLGRLRRRPGAAAVHRRREGPHHAALGEQVQRQALQEVAGDHRVPRVRRAATTGPAPPPGGRRSPTSPSTGRSTTPARTGRGLPPS